MLENHSDKKHSIYITAAYFLFSVLEFQGSKETFFCSPANIQYSKILETA